jgi:hypothetical protein
MASEFHRYKPDKAQFLAVGEYNEANAFATGKWRTARKRVAVLPPGDFICPRDYFRLIRRAEANRARGWRGVPREMRNGQVAFDVLPHLSGVVPIAPTRPRSPFCDADRYMSSTIDPEGER